MSRRPPMSMEASLEEERREVLALLEGRSSSPRPFGARSPSPYTTPRSPVRSMLDIGEPPRSQTPPQSLSAKTIPVRAAPVRSMLDVDAPPVQPVRSMLDVDSPPPAVSKVQSQPTSPTDSSPRTHTTHGTHPRSMSEVSTRPNDFGSRMSVQQPDPLSEYQFSGIITTGVGQPLPKRVTQGDRRASDIPKINDIPSLVVVGDRGRLHSASGPSLRATKSKSPHNRFSLRSHSPAAPILGRHLSPAGRKFLQETHEIDYNLAYTRLSDAALARSGGSLSELGRKKSEDAEGTGRLAKDYLSPDGDILPEESSDESDRSSGEENERGRKASRSIDKLPTEGSKSASGEGKRQAQTLLQAAEDERLQVVATQQPTYQYRSLLDDPKITVANPSGERIKHSKPHVHPATSFDNPPGSGTQTPMDSDTEADLSDIKQAQNLSFAMTQIIDTPEAHRTIQIITRGEYEKLAKEAEEEHRPPRKYLVATDLSEESTHALEWAIGTVLRDGDTLLAIYCVDEEAGIGGVDASTPGGGQVPDEPKAMKEQAAAINTVTSSTTPISASGTNLPLHTAPGTSKQQGSDGSTSVSPAPSATANGNTDTISGSGTNENGNRDQSQPPRKERSRAEEERYRAVGEISSRVLRLLRKTRLQVRVIVEVLHCKNPKHLITEVIDLVNPTLVILGSRGRSALKGVILGSFSNYLVTKSSVPVMVARKRLRKQGKNKRLPSTHQVNNINNPAARSLANAKID